MFWVNDTFELEVSIPHVASDVVYEHLRANKHWLHHPLIVEWRETAPGDYAIIDYVPIFGGMKMRVPYRSKVRVIDATMIRFEGFQNLVYVDNLTSVEAMENGCIVREHVTIRTLRFLKRFVMRQTVESHGAMLNRLKDTFNEPMDMADN